MYIYIYIYIICIVYNIVCICIYNVIQDMILNIQEILVIGRTSWVILMMIVPQLSSTTTRKYTVSAKSSEPAKYPKMRKMF